jgi:hypothetical protein
MESFMKINRITVAALLVVLCCTARMSFGDQPLFSMVCHGGPGMRIMVAHDMDNDGNPMATSMWIFFKAASRPGSAAQPQAGECTWMDRTLGSGEPTALFIHASHLEFAFQVEGDGRLSRDAGGVRLNPEGNSEQAQAWRYLTNGVLKGSVFTVKAYIASAHVLVVKSVGP